jgi:DNA polymerase I
VVHGIVDSLWVTPRLDADQTPLDELAASITEAAGIRLEYEAAYDWIAFVPRKDSEAGALTKYFGSVAGEDAYKFRGIECRQRSTPPFVERVQRELIEVLDETRTPEAVCDHLGGQLARLRAGQVEPSALVIDNRTSKRAEAYQQYTRTVAALERADDVDLSPEPGQDVSYVVVDDDNRSRDRVRLACENPDDYDATFYADRLLRAAESVLAPLDWRRNDIGEYIADQRNATLTAYGGHNAKIQ